MPAILAAQEGQTIAIPAKAFAPIPGDTRIAVEAGQDTDLNDRLHRVLVREIRAAGYAVADNADQVLRFDNELITANVGQGVQLWQFMLCQYAGVRYVSALALAADSSAACRSGP